MASEQMLQFQNQKLSAQLAQVRRDVKDLEKKLDDANQKQGSYEDTLLAVNRVWSQLNEDLRATAASAGAKTEPPPDAKPPPEPLGDCADPFLERLTGVPATKAPKKEDGAAADPEIETALAVRSRATSSMLAGLLGALDAAKARGDALAKEAAEASSDATLKAELAAAVAEAAAARAEARAAQGRARALDEAAAVGSDRILKLQAQGRQSANELSDLQAELDAAHRKIAELQQSVGGGTPAVPKPGGPGASPVTPSARWGGGGGGGGGGAGGSTPGPGGGGGGGGGDKEAKEWQARQEEWEAERGELKALLDKRAKEIEEITEEKIKAQAEARAAAEERNVGDSQVMQSRPYLMLNAQLAEAHRDVAAARDRCAELGRAHDGAQLVNMKLMNCEQALEFHKKELRAGAERVEQAERKCADLARQASDAIMQVQTVKSEAGQQDTVGELKLMVSTLQRELQMMQNKDERRQKEAEQVEAHRQEARAAQHKAEGAESTADRLRGKVSSLQGEITGLKGELEERGRRERELQLFVEVLQEGCGLERAPAQQAAAERNLQLQIDALKKEVEGHPLQAKVEEAEAATKGALAKVEEIEGLAEAARLEKKAADKEVSDLRAGLEAKAAEGTGYVQEIEEIGRAYEEMQAQNTRLLQDLTERDESISSLVAERIRASQAQKAAEEGCSEAELLVDHANKERDLSRERVGQLERQVEDLLGQLKGTVDDAREKGRAMESHKRAAVTAAQAATDAKAELEAERGQKAEKRKRDEGAEKELERERLKRKRGDEDRAALVAKLERMDRALATGGGSEALAQEVKAYKNILKCNVCHSRDKEVTITKCFHLFCKPCIDRNLEVRHRKCPGCGVPFGAADVKKVFFQ